MLTVAGCTIWARDIEALAHTVEGVRLGTCVLVDVPRAGTPALVMVAEPTEHVTDFSRLALAVTATVRAEGGVQLAQCLIIPRGTVPKTSSGTTQRHRCRALAATAGIDPLGSA